MASPKIKGRVLYVEDEVSACRTMIDFLNPRGFAIIISFTAEEAYDLLDRWKPDLILIDVRLVGKSGVDFIESIQKTGIKTPVIVITAYPETITDIERKKLKIKGYFIKPFSYAELYKSIKKVLGVT